MRIAYVALHLGQTIMTGGVGAKLQAQLRLWNELGADARLFLHTPDLLDLPDVTLSRFQPLTGIPLLRSLSRELERSAALARLLRQVAAFRPDLVYLRYGLFTLPLQKLYEIAPVAVEINTNDLDEYRLRGPVFYNFNRLARRVILGKAAGLVTVTHEIAALPQNRAFGKPVGVVSNGIDLRRFEPLPAPNNPAPRMVFVGSPGYSWHGIDKFFPLARRYPDLTIDVIGYSPEQAPQPIPANMRFHGFQPREQVRWVLAQADVGCSSLALHRKNMQEDSPLKVREMLAYGLPIVLSYVDADLSGIDPDFLLKIPNSEDNVTTHAQRIYDFAGRMRGRRAPREVIAPLIDQKLKEESRLRFLAGLLQA